MANPEGRPTWYELMTTDPDAAQEFYTRVVGWTASPSGMEGTGDYRILTAPDGHPIGGIMAIPAGAPMQPGWFSYLSVADTDATLAAIERRGGKVHMPPMDIPEVGRFAMVADPQGLVFYVIAGGMPDSRAFDSDAPGHCAWNELVTPDQKGALAFYGALFGWTNTENMPMGEMGDYAFVDHAGTRLGAIMQQQPQWPPRWFYYFRVPSIAAAMQAAKDAGGAIQFGPQPVPGGDVIILGSDPQGAAFALVGKA